MRTPCIGFLSKWSDVWSTRSTLAPPEDCSGSIQMAVSRVLIANFTLERESWILNQWRVTRVTNSGGVGIEMLPFNFLNGDETRCQIVKPVICCSIYSSRDSCGHRLALQPAANVHTFASQAMTSQLRTVYSNFGISWECLFSQEIPEWYGWQTVARQKLTNFAFEILNHCQSHCKHRGIETTLECCLSWGETRKPFKVLRLEFTSGWSWHYESHLKFDRGLFGSFSSFANPIVHDWLCPCISSSFGSILTPVGNSGQNAPRIQSTDVGTQTTGE
jgi:hypothetical protein